MLVRGHLKPAFGGGERMDRITLVSYFEHSTISNSDNRPSNRELLSHLPHISVPGRSAYNVDVVLGLERKSSGLLFFG